MTSLHAMSDKDHEATLTQIMKKPRQSHLEYFDFLAKQILRLGNVFLGDTLDSHNLVMVLETKCTDKET